MACPPVYMYIRMYVQMYTYVYNAYVLSHVVNLVHIPHPTGDVGASHP